MCGIIKVRSYHLTGVKHNKGEKPMSKYLSPKKKHSNRKLWILLAAVLIALAVLVFAIVKIFDSTLPDEPDDPNTPDIGVQDPDTPTPPQQGDTPGP